jgi:pseudaminic acid cytidylyltransferase
MKLAIIPARGGSKRIPRKNIRSFCGKPIIAWSIEAARTSDLFDHIVVSTDDAEIADVARAYGAEVPFMRPPELSDDHAGTSDVVVHAIDWFHSKGMHPDPVCCIYATAPFMEPRDLEKGLRQITGHNADFAFTVTAYSSPIQRALKLTEEGRIEMFHPENYDKRSQDLEKAYHDAGQFYWGRSDAWCSGKMVYASYSIPIILPQTRVQDIDTLEDWEQAERLFKISQVLQQR